MYAFVVQLLEPYTLLLAALVAATACAWRTVRPRGRSLKAIAVLLGLLVLLSLPVTGYLALGTLEWTYPPNSGAPTSSDTIVILGGGLVVDDEAGKLTRLSDSTLQRCVAGRQLYRRGPGCPVIVCGGKVDWSIPGPTLAEAMRDFLADAGVRSEDLVLEDRSSTTYENAVNAKRLLEGRPSAGRIWLVTEAAHMRRSEGCFRTLGIEVVPVPCDHHAWHERFSIDSFIPSAGGLLGVATATHEWLGLAWYRLRGRI